MLKEEFCSSLQKSTDAMKTYLPGKDPKEDLAFLSGNIKIVKVSRLSRNVRMIICAILAFVVGLGLAAAGIFSKDTVMIIASVVLGGLVACVGVYWFVANFRGISHRAVCVSDNGRILEYIWQKNGTFIFNTIEGETIISKGKIKSLKHNFAPSYSPSFPYVDFLDTNYANFLKARGGYFENKDVFEYRRSEDAYYAYFDEAKKKPKYKLILQNHLPVRFDYRGVETYYYSDLNDLNLKVFIPLELKNKIAVPKFLNAEYIEVFQAAEKVWKN